MKIISQTRVRGGWIILRGCGDEFVTGFVPEHDGPPRDGVEHVHGHYFSLESTAFADYVHRIQTRGVLL